jgi:hypothetical protein
VVTGQHVVDPNAPITGFFEFNPVANGYNFNDGYGGAGGGHSAESISAATRQAVLNKLSADSKFWDFKLNGIDIDHAILHAIATDIHM